MWALVLQINRFLKKRQRLSANQERVLVNKVSVMNVEEKSRQWILRKYGGYINIERRLDEVKILMFLEASKHVFVSRSSASAEEGFRVERRSYQRNT